MSAVEFEAVNIAPPLRNGTGIAAIIALAASGTSQSAQLGSYFGKHRGSHFYTFAADGGTIHVAFASHGEGAIDETDTGKTAGVSWPIFAGQSQSFKITGQQTERGPTGYATGPVVYDWVHYKGSGTLRIYRSSFGSTQGPEDFVHPSGIY